jgi:hypothetical protein
MNDPVAIVEEVINDPTASSWLREALRTAVERDPIDALNDALALADILDTRLRETFGIT